MGMFNSVRDALAYYLDMPIRYQYNIDDMPTLMAENEHLRHEVERYRHGIKQISDYLNQPQPRIGDATFTCEALLAK